MRNPRLCIGLVAGVLTLSVFARAEVPASTQGPTVGLDLMVDGTAGLRGGAGRGESLHGQALAFVEGSVEAGADAQRLAYHGSVLGLLGRGPTGKFLGDFLTVSNSEGFESARLYAWWAELSRERWSLRAGALLADEEFLLTDAGGALINASFGWPAFVSTNTVNTGPAFFAAAPGLRLAFAATPTLNWQVGVYDGDSFDSRAGDPKVNRDGLHLSVGGDQGYFLITQVAVAPEGQAWRGYAGGWWHTGEFSDLLSDEAGASHAVSGRKPRLHAGNGGLFAAIERTWGGEVGSPGTVVGHLRIGASPENRSVIAWAADVAFAWRGPLPSRPDDVLAVGMTHAQFSDDFAAAARLGAPDDPKSDYERVLEVSYTWTLSDRLTLQPDVQWARHPGGSAAQRDSLAVLMRLSASY